MDFVSILVAIVCPFVYMCLLAGLFIYLFRKRLVFQTALPIALLSTTLFVYLFTMAFHNITVGFWITVAAALGFLPLLVLDKDRRQVLRQTFFTPGFAIFSLIYVFLIILDWFKVVPLLSDTSMHWAPHVRTMWLRNDFYTSPGVSIVIHGDYPPAAQLFELIFSKAADVYREGLLFVGMQILGFSMMLPMTAKLVWQKGKNLKQWFMVLLLTLTLLAIPLIFFVSDFYSTLEVDAVLGIVFAYSIYVALRESKKFTLSGLTMLSIAITFLSLTKQIAVLLAGLVVLIYLAGLLISYRNTLDIGKATSYFKRWRKNWKTIALVVIILALLPVSTELWSHQIKGYKSPDPGVAIFHLKATDAFKIPSIVTKKSGSYAQQYFSHHFISHMLFDPGGFLLNYLGSVSYMQLVILFIGAMAFIWFITKDKDKRHRIVAATTILVVGWFLYCFVIYCTFLFGGMKPVEMLNSDTSDRYLRTYLLAMLILVIAYLIKKVILDYQEHSGIHKSTVYFLASIIIVIGFLGNKTTAQNFGVQATSAHKAEFRSLNIYATDASLNKISSTAGGTFKKPTETLITASTDNERHYLQYVALPNKASLLLFGPGVTQAYVCNELAGNNYFIIGYVYPNQNEWKSIENCLSANTNFTLNSVYKISGSLGHLRLQKVF